MIAAARLGLSVAPAGHLGVDVYGAFLEEVLQVRWRASKIGQLFTSYGVFPRMQCALA